MGLRGLDGRRQGDGREGVGTGMEFWAKPEGTSAGLVKSLVAPKACTKKRFWPSIVQLAASAVVQWTAVICGVRTSVPSGVQLPGVPSAATGRIWSLPKADCPKAFSGSSVATAVC